MFILSCFYRTRGSPDFTQPPSSSNSSTTSTQSRRFQFQGLCPISWWTNKSSGNRVPADEPTARSNGTKIEISRPMPIRPNKLGGIGNGSSPSAQSRPPSTSVAHNLVGNYHGVTLSPLVENADSSFDSFDSADSTDNRPTVPAVANKPVSGIVAARANFFSNGVAPSSAATSVPVRPAPAAPVAASAPSRHSVVIPPNRAQALPVATLGHTEIIISKTIVPASESVTIATTNVKPELPPKGRPLSTPNAYNVKAIFNRPEPSQPVQSSTSGSASTNPSALQKMASLFKANPAVQAASVPESTPDVPISGPPNGGSTLPRHQSIKAAKINRESLRSMEISNPILQNVIELPSKVVPVRPAPAPPAASAPSPTPPVSAPPVASPTSPTKLGISSTLPRPPKSSKVHFAEEGEKEDKVDSGVKLAPIVERSESMRLRGVTSRPNIPQFGSMRAKRPLSMPFARPTSPPPMPPGQTCAVSPIAENDYPYDDCSTATVCPEEESIYASIEDLPRDALLKCDDVGSTTTSNSDGLLSEIVCELKKKNLDDVYSVAVKKNEKPTATAETAAPKTAVVPLPPKTSPLKSVIPATTSSQSALKPTTTANSVTTSSAQGYKPYSSSMALRGRYLGATTAGSVVNATSIGTTSSTTKTTASPQPVPVMTSSVPKAPISAVKPIIPLATTAAETNVPRPNGNVPIPLPQQPPVGKLPLTTTSATSVTAPQTLSSANSGLAKTSLVNGISSSKRPMSPDRETNSVKPGVHQQLANAAAKSKLAKTTAPPLANKNPGVLVTKSNVSAGAPKVTKPSITGSGALRSTPTTTNTTTTVSSSKPSTSPSSSVSTSSPVGVNSSVVPSGKNNTSSSSSHVHTMQQKFDTSNSSKGPIISSANSNKGVSALSAKNKSNPKR